MPVLNVVFTEEEMASLRDQAEKEDISLKRLAHDAVLAEVRRRKITALAVRTARASAVLNKRLENE
ncbi:hypothetical protein [Streptomyces montanisoli]|uniref:Uncharacterized protein n=1 Tax=Streptomyces montanisoli TaxID=2798581 RepID=A0A940M5R6_9ACTN|nr:hypothetical protein [Streptomyces montanisoli]MBP0456644.1 hypothetical protein [Streptomyces montanisoli]